MLRLDAAVAEQDPNAITPFQAWTMVFALLGFVLALFSFGWQVYLWRASGPRVSCEVLLGLDNDKMSLWASADAGWEEVLRRPTGRADPNHFLVAFRVTNTGRQATSVTGIEMMMRQGIGMMWPHMTGPPLPHRLEAHDRAEWHIMLETLATGIETHRSTYDRTAFAELVIRPVLLLGTGERLNAEVGLRAADVLRCWESIAGAAADDADRHGST